MDEVPAGIILWYRSSAGCDEADLRPRWKVWRRARGGLFGEGEVREKHRADGGRAIQLNPASRCAQFSAPERCACGRRESVLSATWCVPVAVSFHSLSRLRLLVRTRTVRDRAHPCARERTTPVRLGHTPLANDTLDLVVANEDEGAAQGAENVGGESLPKGHVDRGSSAGRTMRGVCARVCAMGMEEGGG